MTVENDVYKLIITQPKVDDMGKYTIEIGGITCSAYLTVEGTYGFIIALLLQRTIHIFTIFKISFSFFTYSFDCSEADQVYSFVRQLPKKAEAYLNREYELECQVNHHKAPVNWYKGEEKIESDGQRFEISKDLTGTCRLIFKGPIKEDNGEYSCKIERQNLKTTCHLKFIGNFSRRSEIRFVNHLKTTRSYIFIVNLITFSWIYL